MDRSNNNVHTAINDLSSSKDLMLKNTSVSNEPQAPENEPVDLQELLKGIEEINDLVIIDSECELYFLYSSQKTLDEKYLKSLKEETK
jgi:hypothetical protein